MFRCLGMEPHAQSASETLVPEDVQVSNATPEEIRTAIESIVQEEIETEGIPMSEHDYELLLRINMEYWKDRPIFVSEMSPF